MTMLWWCDDQFRDHHLWLGGAGHLEPYVLVTAMIGDKVEKDPEPLPLIKFLSSLDM